MAQHLLQVAPQLPLRRVNGRDAAAALGKLHQKLLRQIQRILSLAAERPQKGIRRPPVSAADIIQSACGVLIIATSRKHSRPGSGGEWGACGFHDSTATSQSWRPESTTLSV